MKVGSILKYLTWPVRLLWRATATNAYPHGEPFYITEPEVLDGRTILAQDMPMRIKGLSEQAAEAKDALRSNLKWRKLWVIPKGLDHDDIMLVEIHCGRGDIAQNMIRQGHK